MERFYEVSESELVELIASSMKYYALESGGVDNWPGYFDSLQDSFKEALKDLGLESKEEEEDFWFTNLAECYLKDYPEVGA